MGYYCKSSRKLSDKEMEDLAINVGCAVTHVGQVVNEARWDYIFGAENLTDSKKNRQLITAAGLEILV